MDPFTMAYKSVKEMELAEQAGDTEKLNKFDFSVTPVCAKCMKMCLDTDTRQFKPMRCGGCQAVIYCSRACQVADWKQGPDPRVLSHKHYCPANKEHMQRVPYFLDQITQFPWGRVESDNTFALAIAKARMGVLGSGPGVGYWSSRSDNRPHDKITSGPNLRLPAELSLILPREYMHGEMLLMDNWIPHEKAWALKDPSHVPLLEFSEKHPPPKLVKLGSISTWKQWYKWRSLPLASPAALLMNYPLTVYHLLYKVLKVVASDSSPTRRQILDVHYLGAEVELNYLPIFSELALLLPHTDLTLTIFGKVGYDIVKLAQERHPDSLAAQNPIWTYTAPAECGGGKITIVIHTENEYWTRHVTTLGLIPDAIVGLNAGLTTYQSWGEPMMYSSILGIPFAVTDYMEQSLQTVEAQFPTFRAEWAKLVGPGIPEYDRLNEKVETPVTTNPFHCPGQRGIAVVRAPNHGNGFCMPLVVADFVRAREREREVERARGGKTKGEEHEDEEEEEGEEGKVEGGDLETANWFVKWWNGQSFSNLIAIATFVLGLLSLLLETKGRYW